MLENLQGRNFSQLLATTFQAVRANWKHSFFILIFLLGPFLLLQAAAEFLGGRDFLMGENAGTGWFKQIMNLLQAEGNAVGDPVGMWAALIEWISFLLYPFVYASILFIVSGWWNGEKLPLKEAAKLARKKYGIALGTLILLILLVAAAFIIFTTFVILLPVFRNPLLLGPIAIIYFGFFVFFLAKISFFLGYVVLEENRQGLGFKQSWKLTRDKAAYMFGFYILLFLIGISVHLTFQFSVVSLLGSSVTAGFLVNTMGLILTLFYITGYFVLYEEVKRQEEELAKL